MSDTRHLIERLPNDIGGLPAPPPWSTPRERGRDARMRATVIYSQMDRGRFGRE